jgi:hypothetical protein
VALLVAGCGSGGNDGNNASDLNGGPADEQASTCLRHFNSVPNNRSMASAFSREPGGPEKQAWIGLSPAGICMAVVVDGFGNAIIAEEQQVQTPGSPPHAFYSARGTENRLPSEAEVPAFARPPNAVTTAGGSLLLTDPEFTGARE